MENVNGVVVVENVLEMDDSHCSVGDRNTVAEGKGWVRYGNRCLVVGIVEGTADPVQN